MQCEALLDSLAFLSATEKVRFSTFYVPLFLTIHSSYIFLLFSCIEVAAIKAGVYTARLHASSAEAHAGWSSSSTQGCSPKLSERPEDAA